MVVDARWTCLNMSETAYLLRFSRFSCITISSVHREWSGKEKNASEQNSRGKTALLMSGVEEEWPDWLKLIEKQ